MSGYDIKMTALTGENRVQHDDHVVSFTETDYPLGGYHIERGMIEADGTHNLGSGDFEDESNVNITSGVAYQHVDQLSVGTNIEQNAIDGAAYLEFLIYQQTTLDRPDAVYLVEIARQDGVIGSGNRQCRAVIDGSEYTWASGNADGNGFACEGQVHLSRRPNGDLWDLATLAAMRFRWGYGTDVSPRQRFATMLYEAAFADGSACTDELP